MHVDALPPEGRDFVLNYAEAEVGQALAEAGWEDVGPAEPLTARVRVLPSGPDVFVLGTLKTRVEYRCVRCLVPFRAPVEAEFHVAYTRERGADAGEWELQQAELDVETLPSDSLDLTAVVSEQLFLGLRPHPVCREACRGLCPTCGADRNETPCGCPEAPASQAFAALAAWGKAGRS